MNLKKLISLLTLASLSISGSLMAANSEPMLKTGHMPVYPTEARSNGLEGIVIIEALIDETGNVFGAEVVQSVHPLLDKAALNAVSQWKFTPAQVDGKSVLKVVRIPISFSLVPENEDGTLLRASADSVAAR